MAQKEVSAPAADDYVDRYINRFRGLMKETNERNLDFAKKYKEEILKFRAELDAYYTSLKAPDWLNSFDYWNNRKRNWRRADKDHSKYRPFMRKHGGKLAKVAGILGLVLGFFGLGLPALIGGGIGYYALDSEHNRLKYEDPEYAYRKTKWALHNYVNTVNKERKERKPIQIITPPGLQVPGVTQAQNTQQYTPQQLAQFAQLMGGYN